MMFRNIGLVLLVLVTEVQIFTFKMLAHRW